MTIRLLGTGAAEGVPAWYSDSRVSEHARRVGGRESRTRCGALIDGCLKIDLPPDTFPQLRRDGLDAQDWAALFFTHSHDDHFALAEIQYGLEPFNVHEVLGYTIFGNSSVCAAIADRYPEWPIDLEETKSFCPVEFGEYRVTPISAHHMIGEDAQNLIFEDGKTTFLYGTDTGVWREPTWEFLKDYRFDGLVLECTAGRLPADFWGHHNLATFLQTLERLRREGILKPNAFVASTHHSHNGDMTYEELCAALEPHGVVAGYDGLEFTL